ncbi:hypothetical protein H0H92_003876 [Tricholoma furcatifolium]|nr:hypothetical protein H0H92_003876 [Tricholoma furcatifolium]
MASVSQAEVVGTLKQDADKGVPVHTFDPSAPPQEKGAEAGKARDQLKSVNGSGAAVAKEIPLQNGPSTVVPTITIQDTDHDSKPVASGTTQSAKEVQEEAAAVPGAYSTPHAPAIPDWYRVGWRQAAGIDNISEGEEKDKGVLDLFLSEQYYGEWYHNAAIMIFAVVISHFLTRFNFGWGWLFIVLAGCATYYSTSLERVRRRARDDIQRELTKTRLASEHESADWMNNFLDRFWLIYEPVLSATIVSSVDQILSTNTPAFLDSLRLTTFTLGTKAPHIDKVRTFPKTEEDVIMMDWGISFTPNDVEDLTPRQLAKKVNPKIVLSIRIGKGLATASMPVLVEDITFSGLMRIRMKLMSNFPHVQIVDFCFLEKPVIDYVLKPIGGDTFGFDIANIPGLSSFIRDMTHGTLGPMMYDPNVFTLNLEQMLSGKPLDAAIGVLQVNVRSARGIKGTKIGGGTPDPYITLNLNDRAELARTAYQNNTYNPTWDETKFVLINSLQDTLVFSLWDWNEHRKDSHMGSANFELSKLIEDATREDIHSPILKDGKERGEVKYDVSYYPVLEAAEGEPLPESSVGIVRLTLHQAKDLDASKSLSGDLNPMAKVFLGDSKKAAYTTAVFKHTNSPVWESAYEFLCSDKASSVVTIKVIDERDFLKDPVVGHMSIKLTDLLSYMGEAGRDWFPLSSCKTGKIRISAEWKPLAMAGSVTGAESYTPPIGVITPTKDLIRNVEATLGGKSDPYVRVLVNNQIKARTEVVNNSADLNPVWDQIVYIPVHSLRQTLLLEVMDYQNLTKVSISVWAYLTLSTLSQDRTLGTVELQVNELAKESQDYRYPFESNGPKDAAEAIRLSGNHYKGTLHYTANFIPALALNGVTFGARHSAKDELQNGAVSRNGGPALTITGPATYGNGNGHGVPKSPETPVPKSPSNGDSRQATPTPEQKENGSVHEAEEAPKGVDMTVEEVLSQQSGIIVFNVVSGNIARKARLEVLLDEGYWPCFSTPKARSTNAQWDHTGEGFIREIDFNQVWLRLNLAEEGEKDDVIAEWKGDAKAFLQATIVRSLSVILGKRAEPLQNEPSTFTLVNEHDENASTVKIETRYVPVPVKLEPRESINTTPDFSPSDQGILRVELLDAAKLHAADRSGKSDPFAVFTLNGEKVFQSQVKKKTLTPEWNETFAINVTSRVGSHFEVEVFDWDQVGAADTLGSARIELEDIEPFQASERVLDLHSTKVGDKGYVRIRMTFQPSIIARARKNTSTFSTAGRAVTQLGGAVTQIGALPVNVGLTAGKNVLHGVTGITGLFKHGHGHHEESESVPPVPQSLPSGQASQPAGVSEHATAFPVAAGEANIPSESGTLRVTVLDAKDLSGGESKPYASIRVGDRELKTKHLGKTTNPEWNESFAFGAGPHTPKLFAWIHDHKTIGKDKDIGEGEIDIWRHIQARGNTAADVTVELRPSGLLRLRLEFDAGLSPGGSGASITSGDRTPRAPSITHSPSRFSIARSRKSGPDAEY